MIQMAGPTLTGLKEYLLPPADENISEGEEIICDFLDDCGYDYQREVVIAGLRGDGKGHRRADFYLPKYKLYIEFFGRWNHSKEERERYREKKNVYWQNRIPCVYLYPENLGTLDHSFQRRAVREFQAHGLRKELLFFNLKTWWSDHSTEVLIVVALIYGVIYVEGLFERLFLLGFLAWGLFYLARRWHYIFRPIPDRRSRYS